MAGTFLLEVVTPERSVFSGEVSSLQAPALDGLFGVLHNRAPVLSALAPGVVNFDVVGDRGKQYLAISGGFFQIANNKAVLLADQAEFGGEIDLTEAKSRFESARQELPKESLTAADTERRQRVYAAAAARVSAAEHAQR